MSMKNTESKLGLIFPTATCSFLHYFLGGGLSALLIWFSFGTMDLWGPNPATHSILGWLALAIVFILWFPASLFIVYQLNHTGESRADHLLLPAMILQSIFAGYIEAKIWRAWRERRRKRNHIPTGAT